MKLGFAKQPSSFPPGRQPLPQEVRDAFKRERVAMAVAEVSHRVGVGKISVSAITAEAKMARNTFYDLFANRDEAVSYAARLANGKLRSRIEKAAGSGGDWPQRVAAILEAVCETAAAEPHLYELGLAEGCITHDNWTPYDPALVGTLTVALRPGEAAPVLTDISPRTDELVVYGVLSVIAGRLRRREGHALPALASELADLVKLPYLSAGAADLAPGADEVAALTSLDLQGQR
jgi:AcrR family transcriptional regulator